MRRYDPTRALAAIHVPKCAGSSVQKVMKRWFGWKLLQHYFNEQTNEMPVHHRLEGGVFRSGEAGVCVYGHFNRNRGFGVWDYYPGIRQFVTILRDPFEMAVSNYFHCHSQPKPWYREGRKQRASGASLAENLSRLEQTFLLQFFPMELTLDNWCEHIEEHFIWVGVTEHLQDSLDIIADKLGKPRRRVPVINTSPRSEEATDQMRQEFRDRHQLEYEVYEYALQLHRCEMARRTDEPVEAE